MSTAGAAIDRLAAPLTASRLRASVLPADQLWDRRRDWAHLQRASATRSLFLTWEWQESWWRHMGHGDLWPVSVHAGDGQEPVALVPLYRDRVRWRGLPLRTLRLVGDGSGDGDDLDAIVRAGHEGAAARALLRLLDGRRDWDLLELHPVPAGSAFLMSLERAARRYGMTMRRETYGCTYTPLPGSWDDYLATLPSRLRSRVRSLLRRTVDSDDATLHRVTSAAELDRGLDLLFELHQQRWQAAGGPGAFATAARREFFRDVAFRALQHGWLRLYTLTVGEQPVAVQIGYAYDGVFLQVQEGFAPAAAAASPGVALRAAVLRECIADGLHAYDNLLGTPPQKMRWGGTVRHVHRLSIARRRSLAAAVLRARNRFAAKPDTDADAETAEAGDEER